VPTTTVAPGRAFRARAVGVTAIAQAASVVIQNVVVVAVHSPAYGDPLAEVVAFHAQHRSAVAVVVGLEAFNLPLLLAFLTGLHGLVGRRGGAGADWSRLALAAGATLSAVLALYAATWSAVVLSAAGPTTPSPALEIAWQIHAAAFALTLPALGVTLAGAALAAHASGLTPRWQLVLALVGAGLLVVAGAASLPIADGSSWVFVGLPGYFAWPVWLLATGLRLMRTRTADGPARA
jgi:hypothetical protein